MKFFLPEVGKTWKPWDINNQIAREILGMTANYETPEEKAQWPFQHTEQTKAGYIAAKKLGERGMGKKQLTLILQHVSHGLRAFLAMGKHFIPCKSSM